MASYRYAPGPVETLAMKFLGMRNVRDLERLQPGTPDWMKLKSFLKNVLVTTVMARSTKSRPIKDIVQAAGRYEFEKDGMTTTVQVHLIVRLGDTKFTMICAGPLPTTS